MTILMKIPTLTDGQNGNGTLERTINSRSDVPLGKQYILDSRQRMLVTDADGRVASVYRIRYANGNFGGWAESEANVSQTGMTDIDQHSIIFGSAVVKSGGRVTRSAVSGGAVIEAGARVIDSTISGRYAIKNGALIVRSRLISGEGVVENAVVKNSTLEETIDVRNSEISDSILSSPFVFEVKVRNVKEEDSPKVTTEGSTLELPEKKESSEAVGAPKLPGNTKTTAAPAKFSFTLTRSPFSAVVRCHSCKRSINAFENPSGYGPTCYKRRFGAD